VAKKSSLAEVWVTASGTTIGFGRESGRTPPHCGAAAPLPAGVQAHATVPVGLAEQTRRRLVAACPGAGIGVHIVRADLDENAVARTITVVRALVGADPLVPLWSRSLPLRSMDEPVPESWIEALGRVVAGLAPARSVADPVANAETLVIDVFAAADLVRAAASAWLGARSGTVVASAAVRIDDPGWWFDGPPVDAEGHPIRPLAVVRDGRLFALPRSGTGSLVRGSWREQPAMGWRSLRVSAVDRTAFPEDAVVLERIITLPRQLLGCGTVRSGGKAVASWGPVPIPAPSWWLQRVTASCGAPVADGEGVPVDVPPLVVAPMASPGPPWYEPRP
jgi:hypothetical protein